MPNFHETLTAVLILSATTLAGCSKGHDSGAVQKATGRFESAVGDLTGSEKLKRDGKKDEVIGGVKSVVGDVKDTVHDAVKSH